MSYALSSTASREDLREALGHAVARVEATPDNGAGDERTDHLTAALVVVDRMLEAVGRPEDHVTVSISGHANAGHAPAEGWAHEQLPVSVHEQLTVSVTACPVPAAADQVA